MSGRQMHYIPEPHEQAYYDGLFAVADTQKTGFIGGAEAVRFFGLSQLPQEILKSVWTVADQPQTNSLDKPKFAIALRMIQLTQNGVKGQGTNLEAPPGVTLRPVVFQGVSGTVVPMPPPPQPQQQQQQPPQQQQPTPPRPPQQQQPQPPAAPSNLSITPQDPYTMTPTDQARYEDVFKQCAEPDGFCYGAKAVDLFSKSGMPPQQLGAIWSMVDHPVDNRLDKLEFSMAMHLIVCVTKKNLPFPPALPVALKQLKSQQAPVPQQQPMQAPAQSPQQQPMQAPLSPQQQMQMQASLSPQQQMRMQAPLSPQQQGLPSPQQMGGPPPLQNTMAAGMPPPPLHQQAMQQPPPIPSPQMQPSSPTTGNPPPILRTQTNDTGMSNLTSPPPLAAPGGASISDAFEGLDSVAGGSVDNYLAAAPPLPNAPTTLSLDQKNAVGNTIPEPASPQLAAAARGTIGGMSPPVPQHIVRQDHSPQQQQFSSNMSLAGSVVSRQEVDDLKATLQKLQAENIALKAQMGNLHEEEVGVQRELADTAGEIGHLTNELTTARAQVLASKSRLLEMAAELKAAEEKKGVITDLITEVNTTKKVIDEATEGIEKGLENVQVQEAPALAAPQNYESDLFGFGAPAAAPQQDNAFGAPMEPGNSALPGPSDTNSAFGAPMQPGSGNLPEPTDNLFGAPMQPGSGSLPEPTDNAFGAPMASNSSIPQPTESSFGAPMASASNASLPSAAPQVETVNSLPSQASQDMYLGHQKTDSTMSGFGDVMGGASAPAYSMSMQATAGASDVKSPTEIETLKSKLREAENVARDAEETRRQLAAQADELRRVADESEKKLRDHMKATDGKKKGMFGGKKKKNEKEAEKLAQDAKTKKEAFLQSQSQVNDANSLAKETKVEADRLRQEAEDAELNAAAAASMQTAQPPAPSPAPASNGYPPVAAPPADQAMPSYPPSTGEQGGFGMPAMSGFGGGAPSNSEFNPSVMGSGGGIEIPTPSGNDPYDNPFAS